jgi:hypothetical protein
MNHHGHRALRDGDGKHLRVDGNNDLFNIAADERERAELAAREPANRRARRPSARPWSAGTPACRRSRQMPR